MRRILPAACLLLALSGRAYAQAWTLPKGEASLSIGWSYEWADHHITWEGLPDSPGDMLFHSVGSDLSYGVTDRFSVRASLPFVVSKYVGDRPHPPRPGTAPYDDGTWNGTFQDFRGEVRFRATTGTLAVTPVVALVVGSHPYEYLAHSAPGRALTEGQFGVSIGRTLDPILSRAFAQVRLVYAVPEKLVGVSHNRTDTSADVGYFITRSLTASVSAAWTKTYGGWRATIDYPPPTSPDFQHHDQLRRTEYLHLGGGISFALTGSVDVSLGGFLTTRARSDVNMSGASVNITYGFSPSQIIKRKKKGAEP